MHIGKYISIRLKAICGAMGRTRIAFYNSDGNVLVCFTVTRGARGENADASVPIRASNAEFRGKRFRV